jgi:signal transduction histidine kinase
MKLKVKFGLLIGFLVVVVIVSVTCFMFFAESRFLLDEMETNREDLITSFSQAAKEALVANDLISLTNYLKLLKNTNGFNYAALIDTKGLVLGHTDSFLSGTILADAVSQNAVRTDKLLVQTYTTDSGVPILDLALPIYENNVRVALVRIGFNQDTLAEKVSDAMAVSHRHILVVSFLGLAIGLAGTLILIGMMTGPINRISDGAKLIAQGNLNHKIEVASRDELGDLAREFNRMSGKLKELDQLKSDFVSSVTHELRSPLLSLRLYIDLFIKGTAGTVNDKQKEYLVIMKNCAERLHHFIDDLLDIAKIERGKMEVTVQSISLAPVLDEIMNLFKPQAENKSINLLAADIAKLPEVKADPERTRQVLTNLLSNAVKFTPNNGTITVSAVLNSAANRVEVSVRDTGIGIPKDKLDIIFNKFEQVKISKEHITGSKGTGLGLSIIKGILEAQGGTIRVESELGSGSVFTFTLPVA